MNNLMTEDEWTRVQAAYKRGLTADMIQLQSDDEGEWGVIWTIAPRSADAAEGAGRHLRKCFPRRVRHIRRARMRRAGHALIEVIVVTEAPPLLQEVRAIESGIVIPLEAVLADAVLQELLTRR